MFALAEGEMQRNWLIAGADLQRYAMVFQQQVELLAVIVGKQVRPCQRCFIAAGAGDEAIGQARIGARHGFGLHTHEGVAGAYRADVLAGNKALQGRAQMGHAGGIDLLRMGQCRRGIGKFHRGNESRGLLMHHAVPI